VIHGFRLPLRDLSRELAASICSMMLADLGAETNKIEKPREGVIRPSLARPLGEVAGCWISGRSYTSWLNAELELM